MDFLLGERSLETAFELPQKNQKMKCDFEVGDKFDVVERRLYENGAVDMKFIPVFDLHCCIVIRGTRKCSIEKTGP